MTKNKKNERLDKAKDLKEGLNLVSDGHYVLNDPLWGNDGWSCISHGGNGTRVIECCSYFGRWPIISVLLTQKRGTESATVPLHGSIWLKGTKQKKFSLSLPSPYGKLALTPTSQHNSLLRIFFFFPSFKPPSGNNCNFTLWHTPNVPAFERLSQWSTRSGCWRGFLGFCLYRLGLK